MTARKQQKGKKQQKKQVTRRGKAKAPRPPIPAGSKQTYVSVAECSRKFAAALSDPWSPAALGVCLPMEPVRPSQKICQRVRMNAAFGVNGTAFCLVSPCLVNNMASAWFSLATYAGASGTAAMNVTGNNTTTTTGVDKANMTGLPWDMATFMDQSNRMAGRIVAVGLKATYTGTTLNQSGTWSAFISADGGTLADNTGGTTYSVTALSNYPAYKSMPITRKPVVLATGPLDYEGYNWSTVNNNPTVNAYPWATELINSTSGGTNGAAPIAIHATGGVAGQGILFELIIHYEFVGKLCTALSPSHNDEIAAKALLTTATSINQSPSWKPSFSGLMQGLTNVLTTGTRVYGAMRSAAPMLRAAAAVPLLLP